MQFVYIHHQSMTLNYQDMLLFFPYKDQSDIMSTLKNNPLRTSPAGPNFPARIFDL